MCRLLLSLSSLPCLLLALALPIADAHAQSADQQLLSAVDNPDPVIPGQLLTYTIQTRNNGPNAAVNGGLNVNLANELTMTSMTAPSGFSCAAFGNNLSCTHPSFAANTTATFTIVARLGEHLLNFPDGQFSSNFFSSGTTPDPVQGNEFQTVVTRWDSPQVDIAVTAADAPDPVGPNQDITYSVLVRSLGPDTPTNVNFNVFNNNSLRFVSNTAPAGFNCTLPAVGGAPVYSCSIASLPPGNYPFTVVLRADLAVLGPNDGSVAVNFASAGTGDDTDDNNNSETEVTTYVTPDADIGISVSDSPDPVVLGGDITFNVAVTNAGPDPGTTTNFNMFNSGDLRFVSLQAAPGFNCNPPAVGTRPTFTCTHPSMPVGQTANFVVITRTDPALINANGGTISNSFTAASSLSDPVGNNNAETEQTLVLADGLFKNGFE